MGLFDRIKKLFTRPKTDVPKVEKPTVQSVEKSRHLGTKEFIYKLRQSLDKALGKQPPKQEITKEVKPTSEEIRKEYYERENKPWNKELDIIPPNRSDIILQELERRLSTWESDLTGTEKGERASKLQTVLQEEISSYGRARVAYSCEQAGHQIISNAQVYVFDSDSNERNIAYTMFLMLLRSEIMSKQDAMDIGQEQDANETDYNPFEDE